MQFANAIGGTSADQGQSIAVDSSGNSYVTGYFAGTVDFDPGAGTTNLTSAGNNDIFIAKYDSSGGLVWAKNVGGTSNEDGDSIQVDSSGNIYVTGNFGGTVDFDPGAGTTNLTGNGSSDIFFAKYDSSGNLLWAKAVGGTSTDNSREIQVDSSGNSYVTGDFIGTVDFDPDAGTTNLASAGSNDIFIAKYDSSGGLVWAKRVGGTSGESGRSIQVDSSGNSYVTGSFDGTVDFDPGAGTANLTGAGSNDIFLAKYDSSGNFVWAKNVGGTSIDSSRSIQVDSSGNSYVTGYFSDTVDFDPGAGTANLTSAGNRDVFIAKYDSSGDLVWAKGVGGTSGDEGYSIQVDSSGNSYVTGSFRGTVDFDPGAGTTNLTTVGNRDIFIAKYDSSGNLVWARNAGGTSDDIGQSIQVDSSGNSYVTGSFTGTVDFDPGDGEQNLTSAGNVDIFLLKLDSDGNFVSVSSGSSGSSGAAVLTRTEHGESGFTLTNNTGADATGLLVSNTGSGNTITATLPSGLSLTQSGTEAAVSGAAAGSVLTGQVQGSGASAANQALFDSQGQSYIDSLGDTLLDIRTITFSGSNGAQQSVQFTGSASGGGEAFIIDSSGLTPGSTLQLDHIDFAAVLGNATITGGAGSIHLAGDDAAQSVTLREGNDIVAAGGGNDTVSASWGEDLVYGNQGTDSLLGGGGMDTLYGGQDADLAHGGNDADLLYGNMGRDTLFGGGGTDRLYGGQDADMVYGNAGNDTLYGDLGEDTLCGGQGNDALFGGGGADWLAGNRGDDTLSGGAGADTFVFEFGAGNDVVNDFEAGIDTLALEGGLGVSGGVEEAGNTVVTFSDGGTLTVIGVNKTDLAAATGWDLG